MNCRPNGHSDQVKAMLVVVLIVFCLDAVGIQAVAADPVDVFGDPLPAGAVARAGTVRTGDHLPDGFERPSSLRGVVISPDGQLLATRGEPSDPASGRVVNLWDVNSGKLLRSLVTHNQPLTALVFSADSRRLISSTPDHPQGTQIWDAATGKLVRSLPGGRGPIALGGKGRTLSVVDRFQKNDVIRTFDMTSGAEVGRAVVDVSYRYIFSADGARQLSQKSDRSATLKLLDVVNGKQRARFEQNQGTLGVIAFSSNGRTIAVATSHRIGRDKVEHLIVVWEVASERPVFELAGHSKRVLALSFSPDGRYLASGSADRSVRVWEVATGNEVHAFSGHAGPVSAVDISANNMRLASGSFDRTALVWDLAEVQRTFLTKAKLDAESFERLWDELAAVSPSNAYRAIGQLRTHEQASVEMLHARIESIVRPVQAERIRGLIDDLEHEDYVVRFRATQQLQKLREIARPMLLKVAKETTSAEARFRIRRILTGAEATPRFSTADIRRIARVIHTLEFLPGQKSKATLQAIIDDFPAAEVVAEAKATLARLRAME